MNVYRKYLIPAALALVYLASVVPRPLFRPDETRYAEMAREMLESGNWIVPKLVGVEYFEKPIGGIWLLAASMKLFGENPFAVRLPGVIATLLTALLVRYLGRRSGNKRLGDLAALVFLLTGLVFAIGTFTVLDAPLMFFITLTMTMMYAAYTEKKLWKRGGFLLLAGAGCGAAFLIKGLLALALPAMAMVPFLLWEKEWKRIFTLPWLPLLGAAAVAAPWAWAVHCADGDFWRQFVMVEHFQRAMSGAGANDDRSQPFWYYIPVLLGGLMPWTLFLPALWRTYRPQWREAFRLSLLRFAATMAGVWFIAFSCSSGKLGTYILPCFPALAILIAYGLLQYREDRDFRFIDPVLLWASRVLGAAALLVSIWQILLLCHVLPTKLELYPANWFWLLPVAAVLAAVYDWTRAQRSEIPKNKFLFFGAGLATVMLVVHACMPPRFLTEIAPEEFLHQNLSPYLAPDVKIAASDGMATSVAWTLRDSQICIYHKQGELQYGLSRPAHQSRAMSFEQFEALNNAGRKIIIVTNSKSRVRELPTPQKLVRAGKISILYFNIKPEK